MMVIHNTDDIGNDDPNVANTLDTLTSHMEVRRWKTKPIKIQVSPILRKFLGVQW